MSKTSSMNSFKAFGLIIFTLSLAICVVVNIFYFGILFYAPQKVVAQTYKVGMQKLENGSDSKTFVEVKYFKNEKKNGIECFEVKFNYLLDENQEQFFSQGMQFCSGENSNLDFSANFSKPINVSDEYSKSGWPIFETYQNKLYLETNYKNLKYFNYMSADDYKSSLISTNPINLNSSFKIQLGDDLFLMKFRGQNSGIASDRFLTDNVTYKTYVFVNERHIDYCYRAIDPFYFAEKLYDSIKTSVDSGTNNQIMTFEFGDLFDYYEYDAEKGQYKETRVENSAKIKALLTSYYSIKVSVVEDGIRSADESLFKCVNGTSNFKINGYTEPENDFFTGRAVIDVDVSCFKFIEVDDSGFYVDKKRKCLLTLTDEFINTFEKFKNKIQLNIVIDLDYLKNINIEFIGFENGTFDGFKVFKCETTETIDGETQRKDYNLSSGNNISSSNKSMEVMIYV